MYIPPWSASSVDAYRTCPHKFYRLRVLKDVQDFPPSEAIMVGRKMHKAFENAVNLGEPLPKEYASQQALVDKIKAIKGEKLAEFPFFIDQNYHPCDRKDAWTRGIADLVIKNGKEAIIIDYKTGKRKPSDQLALYAAYAFETWPEIQKVHTAFIWLKEKKIDRESFTREDKCGLWQRWLPAVTRMMNSYRKGDWPKQPSGLCRQWCPVKDCDFCGQ